MGNEVTSLSGRCCLYLWKAFRPSQSVSPACKLFFPIPTISIKVKWLKSIGKSYFEYFCLATATTSICREIDYDNRQLRSHMVGGKLVEISSPSKKVAVLHLLLFCMYEFILIQILVFIWRKMSNGVHKKARIKICSKSWISTPFVSDCETLTMMHDDKRSIENQ